MGHITVAVGIVNTIVLFVISGIPDTAAKVELYIAFGILLGIPWVIKGLYSLLGGIVSGAIIGAFVSALNSIIETSSASATGIESFVIHSFGFIIGLLGYTALGSGPFLLSSES
ncbi:MAG: hypothetical protein D4S01_03305 [Dehalococcoidia bacterium]|nr:MAG: hypothetical protein D4S01_03305 [Dehalococcoidia bacterium]